MTTKMHQGIQLRRFRREDVKDMVQLWNKESTLTGYKSFAAESEFEALVVCNPNFSGDGCILAFAGDKLAGMVIAVCKREFLMGESKENTPGYISMLLVDSGHWENGIGSMLLYNAEEYLKVQGKKEFMFSHKCPVKLSWYVDSRKREHNNAPGVKYGSRLWEFLVKHGYKEVQRECSYCRSLESFTIPDETEQKITRLKLNGITIADYDSRLHMGYEEMFERLHDGSFLKKFQEGITRGARMLVAVTREGRICATAGVIDREDCGRGSFSALAVDPQDAGKGIGSALFFSLCKELKDLGAEYMTLFVTDSNVAVRIYEKAGFSMVQEWSIMMKRTGGCEHELYV